MDSAQTTVGTATIGVDSTANLGLQVTSDAGFYAISYNWNGQTVISYRGTNIVNGLPSGDDVANGWAIAPGDFMASQFALPTQFLSAVAQTTNPDNIILTGHSPGGHWRG